MEAGAIGYFNAELVASVARLQQQLGAVQGEVAKLQAERDTLAQQLEAQKQDVAYYKERYSLMQRQLFGKKSEKRELDESLMRLLMLPGFGDEERPAPPAAPRQETIPSYTRMKPDRKGTPLTRSSRFPEHLRRVVIQLAPEETNCSCCGKEMTNLLKTRVTEKLACSRDPFYVQEYHCPVLTCRDCEEVAPAAEVPEVFERSSVDHTVVAYLLVNKFRYSLPLFRQGQMFRDIDVLFSNDALIDWVLKALDLLSPIYRALVSHVLRARYLLADDTKLRAAVGAIAKKQPGYRQGCLWGLYAVEQNAVAYVFTKSRTHEACREVLQGFRGYLIVDGYDGFEDVAKWDGVTLVNCNNHARRGFVRAEGSDKQRAHEGLAFYQELYRIEELGRDLSAEERKALRQQYALPVLEKCREWLEAVGRATPPKSPLGKACAYVLKRWASLIVYTKDGTIPIDTNMLERAFRVVAVGRKNFLHASSELGAHGAAIGYSLINTCLAQGVDPFIYLCDVLERVETTSQHEVEQLLPHNWKTHYLEAATARYQTPPGLSAGMKLEATTEQSAAVA